MKLPDGKSRLDLVKQGLSSLSGLPKRGRFVVAIDRLLEDPKNERKIFRNMDGLIESVRAHGIVEPITVTPEGESYRILTGHRRFRAAKASGLKEIEVLVREPEDTFNRRLKSIISNVQREDIAAIEMAEALQALLEEDQRVSTQRGLAHLIGKREAWVSDMLRILTLPAKLQEKLRSAEVSIGYDLAMRIARADDTALQNELFERALKGESGQQIRQALRERQPETPVRKKRASSLKSLTESMEGYTATVRGPEADDANEKMRAVLSALLDSIG
jgi:ParB family chromosome partitioning protein